MFKAHRPKPTNKFFTNPIFALECINKVFSLFPKDEFSLIVDSGAGNGSFCKQIDFKNIVALDILPESSEIIQMDYFDYQPDINDLNALVIGNPPFGRCDDLAVKFFNHSAQFSRVIAYIVPISFQHIKVQNQLNDDFHLIHDYTIPTTPCCFLPITGMRCCFQIWVRKDHKRPIQTLQEKSTKLSPNGTKMIRLGDIATFLKTSKNPARSGKESGLYPFYTAGKIQKKFYDSFDFNEECLVFARGGLPSIHYPILPFACANSTHLLKINEGYSTQYVYYYFKCNMNLLQEQFKGSALQHITQSDLLNIQIPIISLDKQNEIVERINRHMKKNEAINQQITQLKLEQDEQIQKVERLIVDSF